MKNVEDIYPLSPMQKLMLTQTLVDQSDVLTILVCWKVCGPLDHLAFQQAWEHAVGRHTILRTAFLWENLEQPLQIVRQKVRIPWQYDDWREMEPVQQQESLQALIIEGERRIFNVARAPLIDFKLIRCTYDIWYFLVGTHHIVLDAWSMSILFDEAMTYYEAFRHQQNPQLAPASSYRAYIEWLGQQNSAEAEAFWRKTLGGFTVPTPLPTRYQAAPSSSQSQERYRTQELIIPPTLCSALRSCARQYQVTINTVLQGIWAVLLSQYSGSEDIIFGVTVSGRPANFAGVDSIVGLFINNLPLRIHVEKEKTLADWLQDIQKHNSEQRQYEYCPLAHIQEWSDVPRSQRLFESLLIFENYPRQERQEWDLHFTDLKGFGKTGYPLALFIEMDQDLSLLFSYDTYMFAEQDIALLAANWQDALAFISSAPKKGLVHQIFTATRVEEPFVPMKEVSRIVMSQEKPLINPRSDLEIRLTCIWEELLGIHPISVIDNFFDLGGHSFLAMQLASRIRAQFGQQLSVQAIFQASTIEAMAKLIGSQPSQSVWSPLVPIQPLGSNPPFFCVHPGPGSVFCYVNLARSLGTEQPFYGLQARGLDGIEAPATSVIEMASCYIDAIRSVQPQGPYYLGGHSFGGIVAFEMAQQLRQQAQDVALLLIIDVVPPSDQEQDVPPEEDVLDRAMELVDTAHMIERFLGNQLGIHYEELSLLDTDQQLTYFLERAKAVNFMPLYADVLPVLGLVNMIRATDRGYRTYKPKLYPGQITLFRASSIHPDDEVAFSPAEASPTFGWSELSTQAVNYHTIEGDHISMLTEPYVKGLAKKLRECLEQAQQRSIVNV